MIHALLLHGIMILFYVVSIAMKTKTIKSVILLPDDHRLPRSQKMCSVRDFKTFSKSLCCFMHASASSFTKWNM